MNAKHTPEPWEESDNVIDGCKKTFIVDRKSGRAIAEIIVAHPNWESNSARIVAAVNACAGIPTEALEAGELAEVITWAKDAVKQAKESKIYVPADLSDSLFYLGKHLSKLDPKAVTK